MHNSTPEFEAKLQQVLSAFRAFAEKTPLSSARLVHYAGANEPNGMDVNLTDAEAEISSSIAEGFHVDWAANDGRLYLLIQEPDGPLPAWDKVFAEAALVDVNEILRQAGLRGDV